MKRTLGIALFALSLGSAASAAVTGVVVDDDGAPIAGASVRAFPAETQRATASRILAGQLERQPIAKVETAADGSFRLDTAGAPLVTVTISAPDRVLLQFDASDGDDAGPLMLTAMKSHKLKITAGGKPLANAILAAGSVWAGKTGADGTLDIPQIVGPFLNIAILHPDYAPLTPGLIPQTPEISLPAGKPTFIYDASIAYQADGTNLVVIGGEDYGMGSSRDWAAKGSRLLGVKAVVTKSFERIHRSNLIGMGVLPLNFVDKADYDRVKDLQDVTFDITGLTGELKPMQTATLVVHPRGGASFEIPLKVRLDTPAEVDYYLAGGILPYVLDQILEA